MIFRHRRLLCLSLFALLSVAVAEQLPHAYKAPVFWTALTLALVLFALSLWKRRLLTVALALLLSSLAVFSSYQISYKRDAVSHLKNEALDMTVTVVSVQGEDGRDYIANGHMSVLVEGEPLSLPVKVVCPSAPSIGDVLFGKATYTPFESGAFQASQGFYGTVRFLDACRVVDRASSPTLALSALRARIAARIRSALPDENGELLCALLIGVRDGLPDAFSRDMSRLGTVHMLSLSGMHLVVLTAGIAFLLKRLRLGRRLRVLFLSAFVVFFMLLTGLSSSVMRAGFMFLFSSLPFFLREERDSVSSLTAAVALIAVWEPYAIADLSLWLSALSTLGILLFFDRWQTERERRPSLAKRCLRYAALSLSVTLAATLVTLPLTLCVFGTLPLLSPIGNLLLSPLTQLALYLGLAVAVLGSVPVLSWTVSVICKPIFTISSALGDIPNTVIALKHPVSLPLVFLLFALLLGYFLFTPKRRFPFRFPVTVCVCFSVLLTGVEGFSRLIHREELTVSYYSAEGEESDVLLFSYRGDKLLTVFSDFSYLQSAERQAPRDAAGELDGFLLPYYTKDSAEYTKALIQEQKVYALYLPTPQTAGEWAQYKDILSVAAACGTKTVATDDASPFFFGFLTASRIAFDLRLDGYAPRFAAFSFLFGYSRISYYSADALTADAGGDARASDILVFGKYGNEPQVLFHPDDFIAPDAEVLCSTPTSFPFVRPSGFVFSYTGTAYLPMKTNIS